ncbi:MAG: ORF6C domain-containing protein [Tetragenococcus koreensis]|nr:ORF6C domain-containing protein [Tetragenococcus koreensis]
MGNQQLEERNNTALIHTLRTQGQQSEALAQVMEDMYNIKESTEKKFEQITDKVDESLALYDKLSKEITINYDEQKEIQSLVNKKAGRFTNHHSKVIQEVFSDNMFKAWKGLFIRKIYAKLKKEMNVVRYTAVKKLDYKATKEFLQELSYDNFSDRELTPSPKILELRDLESK